MPVVDAVEVFVAGIENDGSVGEAGGGRGGREEMEEAKSKADESTWGIEFPSPLPFLVFSHEGRRKCKKKNSCVFPSRGYFAYTHVASRQR